MSITILTGAPGHGKSYTSVKMIDEFVHAGKPVVTNVPLRSDFAVQMARYHTPFGFMRKKAVAKKVAKYQSMVHVCEDISEITRVRFSGKGEGRGKVVIDEAHRHMNVRGEKSAKSEEGQNRKEVVEYASGHRHYGADIVLITQALENLDLQIRNLREYHAEVRDFRKLPVIGWIIKILMPGGHLFIRKTTWNDRAKTRAGLTTYGLSKRLACLYDTHSLENLDWPNPVIMLPKEISEKIDKTPKSKHKHGSAREVLNWIQSVENKDLSPSERKRLAKKVARRRAKVQAV